MTDKDRRVKFAVGDVIYHEKCGRYVVTKVLTEGVILAHENAKWGDQTFPVLNECLHVFTKVN